MADTTCPSCDAPAAPGARRCARCGYVFVEDGGRPPRRVGGRAAGTAAAALVAIGSVAAGVAALAAGGGGDEMVSAGVTPASSARLERLSAHPLSNRAAERLLTERFLPVPDDDESDVTCSRRVARPAHSVRRCHVLYPGGVERVIVLVTNASGAEVISER
jgi:hypothetical protein